MGVGLFIGLLGTHGLRVRSVWHFLFWRAESKHSKVAAFLHKSHFVGKDDIVEGAFKQSHIVEKKALESSRNNGDVCAFFHGRDMSKVWAVNVSCDMRVC